MPPACSKLEQRTCQRMGDITHQEVGMTFQVAKVRGPLGSARRICEAGNRVVFDEDGSYIENQASKKRTKIDKAKGV